jgi:hypothetical protein
MDYDVSESAVGCACKLGLEAHLFRSDEYPPLPAGSPDVVAMREVLEHVWNVYEYRNGHPPRASSGSSGDVGCRCRSECVYAPRQEVAADETP